MTDTAKRIAILGASGYTGRELLRWLGRHPGVRVAHAMTARAGVTPEPAAVPVEPAIAPLDVDKLDGVDCAFLCTPHGSAGPLAEAALRAGCKVVDLSADFRLRDAALHARVYGGDAAYPELRQRAVYGLTEHHRDAVRQASLVANPGCYPTAVLLPLLPLLAADLLAPDAPIIADAKSGVSGAGKTPSERTHFGNVHDNFCAYAVGTHRHAPEMHQEAGSDRIVFVPHLLPTFRGILATIYVTPRAGVAGDDVRNCLAERYAGEPFVTVFASGLPELRFVQHTNRCDIAVATCGNQVVLVSAIDNLVKGAAGQAIQNMNLLLGLPEAAGLGC